MKHIWKKIGSLLLSALMLAGMLPAALAEETTQEGQEDMPLLSGMFVAAELVTQENPWTQDDWNRAAGQLKDVGMDKIVLQYTVQYYSESSKVYYFTPTFDEPGENKNNRQQTLEYALNACRDNGMQLWIGLHLAEDMWFSAMSAGFRDVGEDGKSAFLTDSAAYSEQVFDDIWAQYGAEYGDVIGGWYLPYEFNNTVGEAARTRLVQDFYQPLTSHIKSVTPDKPIMVSPLIYPPMLSEPTEEMLDTWKMLCYDVWANSQVDIIAPQDGCGWESSMKENLPPYYEAMDEARSEAQQVRDQKGYGEAVAWNNPELYSMTGSNTMTMRRFSDNMKTVDVYVDEHVSFSLHSLVWFEDESKAGTNVTNRAFYQAYAWMAEHGTMYEPESPIAAPEDLTAEVQNTFDVRLTWQRVEGSDEMPVAGYQIRRVDAGAPEEETILLTDVPQPAEGETTVSMVDSQLEAGHEYCYSVYAYDGAGNLSEEPATVQVAVTDDVLALRTVAAHELAENAAVSAYAVQSAPDVTGDLSALPDGQTVSFRKPEDAVSTQYVISVENHSETPLGAVYLKVVYSPAEGRFFPQKIEVLADGELVDTFYPQQEYGTSMTGEVYLPVSLNGAQASEKLEIVVTQNQKYLTLSEMRIYNADSNVIVPDGYSEPQNLVAGLPVAVTGYAATQNFDANAHFRGTDKLTLDYENGVVTSEANLYKGSYATDLLTRGSADLPLIDWEEDGGNCQVAGKAADADRSVWLRTIGLGSSFDLTVELASPQAVQGVSTEWISDRDATVFLPLYIEYYGMTENGVEQLIGVANRPTEAQIDFFRAPAQDNCHRTESFRYKVLDTSGTVYTKIIARVYPQYPANSHFMRAFAVY